MSNLEVCFCPFRALTKQVQVARPLANPLLTVNRDSLRLLCSDAAESRAAVANLKHNSRATGPKSTTTGPSETSFKIRKKMAEILRQVMKQLVGILRGKEDPAQLFQSRR